jgi:hypothetical protein
VRGVDQKMLLVLFCIRARRRACSRRSRGPVAVVAVVAVVAGSGFVRSFVSTWFVRRLVFVGSFPDDDRWMSRARDLID